MSSFTSTTRKFHVVKSMLLVFTQVFIACHSDNLSEDAQSASLQTASTETSSHGDTDNDSSRKSVGKFRLG